jgi:hypothetical protein
LGIRPPTLGTHGNSLHADVEKASAAVLAKLADLYDPNSMPKRLLNAHQAVDDCYRTASFKTELERLEFLFALYRKYIEQLAEIVQKAAKKLRRR